ncbi:hypothetical protein Tsp_02005 [Trichinella spiralis]|uniref:hypothetical protein n=1 Tax=Trichinella spiralis TaxID=6334 RepID=UPI0001EFBAC4|nr:hypothetical protein Tsp_02005 [Trichinella spiralis]
MNGNNNINQQNSKHFVYKDAEFFTSQCTRKICQNKKQGFFFIICIFFLVNGSSTTSKRITVAADSCTEKTEDQSATNKISQMLSSLLSLTQEGRYGCCVRFSWINE